MIVATLYLLTLLVMTVDSYYRLQKAKSDRDYIYELVKEN